MTNQNNANASKLSIEDLVQREIAELKRNDKRLSSGVIFREVALSLESTGLVVTRDIRSTVYDEIEKQLRANIATGKDWRVKSVAPAKPKFNASSLSYRLAQSIGMECNTDLPIEEQMKQSFVDYENAAKNHIKVATENSFKRLMKFKRLVCSFIYQLKQSGHAESVTMAENYEKGLALIENPIASTNRDGSPSIQPGQITIPVSK